MNPMNFGIFRLKALTLFCLFASCILIANAQYQINGSASQLDCRCFELTPNIDNRAGSVFSSTQISLADTFDQTFDVFLGCSEGGADGLVFTFHNDALNSVGNGGANMGYDVVSPSIGVEVDTWPQAGEPSNDHIAIEANGDIVHNSSANDLAGPVDASSTSVNVEDCEYHKLKILWNPTTTTLSVYFDEVFRLSYTGDIVTNLFSGNPNVYWGFTSATGGAYNQHAFCTNLEPEFNTTVQDIIACANEPFQFNASVGNSALTISDWDWDFGDGNNGTGQNPTHSYSVDGVYPVELIATDANGCKDTINQNVRVFSSSVELTATPDVLCDDNQSQLEVTYIGTYLPSCTYTLDMEKFFSTGWGGGYLEAYVNDEYQGQYKVNTGVSTGTGTFDVYSGDNVKIYAFSQVNGNYYDLLDAEGNILFSDGPFPTSGLMYDATASCPASSSALTYTWGHQSSLDNSAISNPIATLTATDEFFVTVDDGGACLNTDSVEVILDDSPSPGDDNAIEVCSTSDELDLFTQIGGTPGVGGYWTNTSDVIFDGMFNPSSMSSGNYTYILPNPNLCPDSFAVVTVSIEDAPNAGINSTVEFCASATVTDLFDEMIGIPDAGGVWLDPSMNNFSGIFDPATDAVGVYTYTVSGVYVCPDSAATLTVSLSSSNGPGNDASVDICETAAAINMFEELGGVPETGGYWINSLEQVISSTFDPALMSAGDYTYVYVGSGGCQDTTAVVSVVVETPPNAGTSTTAYFCASDATHDLFEYFNPSPDVGGTWLDPTFNTFSGTINPANDAEGVYTYVVSAINVCSDASSNITVTISNSDGAGFDNILTVCETESSFDLFSQLGGNPETGGFWLDASQNPISSTFDPASSPSGNYFYIYNGVGACEDTSAVINVSVDQAPFAGINTSVALCESDSPIDLFDVFSPTPDSGGEWFNQTGQSVSSNFDPSIDNGGFYLYSVQSSNSCPDSVSRVVVFVNPNPTVIPSVNDVSCNGANDGNVSTNVTVGTSPYSYSWSNGSTSQSINSVSMGAYSLTLTDSNSCSSTLSLSISEPAVLTISSSITDVFCKNDCDGSIELLTAGGVSPYSYEWGGAPFQTSSTAINLCAGSYQTTVTDVNGCTISLLNLTINYSDSLSASFIATEIDGGEIETYQFTFDGYEAIDSTTYFWDYGNGDGFTGENPSYTFTQPGTFIVQLTVSDANGCVDTASKKIVVEQHKEFLIPNVFTPNGVDGNDKFSVQGSVVGSVDGSVFNRWGELLFVWNDPMGGWDGRTQAGTEVPEGTYFYIIKIKFNDGTDDIYRGSFSLFR